MTSGRHFTASAIVFDDHGQVLHRRQAPGFVEKFLRGLAQEPLPDAG